MGSFEIVVVGPGLEMEIAFVGIGPVMGIGPLAQGRLDKSLGFSVGSRSVGSGAVVFDLFAGTCLAKLHGAVTGAVVGEQSANADTVRSEELQRGVQKADGGLGFLIRQHLGKRQAGMIVDGDMKS